MLIKSCSYNLDWLSGKPNPCRKEIYKRGLVQEGNHVFLVPLCLDHWNLMVDSYNQEGRTHVDT